MKDIEEILSDMQRIMEAVKYHGEWLSCYGKYVGKDFEDNNEDSRRHLVKAVKEFEESLSLLKEDDVYKDALNKFGNEEETTWVMERQNKDFDFLKDRKFCANYIEFQDCITENEEVITKIIRRYNKGSVFFVEVIYEKD